MAKRKRDKLAERFQDDETVDELVRTAVRNALAENKRIKNSIAVWDEVEQRVKIIAPEDIPDPDLLGQVD